MHTTSSPGLARPATSGATASDAATTGRIEKTPVAVAGATGYTGQELLRLLSRHPGVAITRATSSGTTATRRLPALAHLWDGAITPLDVDALAHDAELVFLALPDTAAAEIGP